MLRWLSLLCLLIAGWYWSGAALIYGKALLAPVLIKAAWMDTLEQSKPVKPWPWADTWPVARLRVPQLGIDQYVLYGANGASLPFGPGHLTGSSVPGRPGTIVIAAHRDTHFGFLSDLKPWHDILVQGQNGKLHVYRMQAQEIVDARVSELTADPEIDQLILVTCEPTDMFHYRGPWRLVVTAVPANGSALAGTASHFLPGPASVLRKDKSMPEFDQILPLPVPNIFLSIMHWSS